MWNNPQAEVWGGTSLVEGKSSQSLNDNFTISFHFHLFCIFICLLSFETLVAI